MTNKHRCLLAKAQQKQIWHNIKMSLKGKHEHSAIIIYNIKDEINEISCTCGIKFYKDIRG